MAMQIRKATRSKAKLRMALVGPTGSGKTYSALRLAFGIGQKIGVIDTENGSADLYADLGDYDVITMNKPYTVASYREALAAFEDAGYDVIIIDSLSHAWAGAGGMLDQKDRLAAKSGNDFTAWRTVTPEHNSLVEAMLTSPAHVIATLRVKTEYVMEKNAQGKMAPRKIGLAPVFRDGIEYEMTLVMDIDTDHKASASKDRTKIFRDWYDEITERTGKTLLDWLESGADAPPPRTADDDAMDRAITALGGAEDRAKVDRIRNYHEFGHLASRLKGAKLHALNDALAVALERTAPAEIEMAAANEPDDTETWPGEAPAETETV